MRGKDKCRALKEIRRQIAENNDIEYVVSECKHKGECKGTCPKCEAEILYLEKELAKRRNMGQKVAVAGIAVGMAASMTGCVAVDAVKSFFTAGNNPPDPQPLGGEATIAPVDVEGEETYYPEDQIMGDVAVEFDSSEPCSEEDCSEEEKASEQDSSKALIDNYELEGGAEYIP